MIDTQNNTCYGGPVNKYVNNFSVRAAGHELCQGRHNIVALVILALLLISIRPMTVHSMDYLGGGTNIMDSMDDGTNAWNPGAGISISDIVIADPGVITSFNSLTLDTLEHTAIGDLIFELTHVDTATTVIFLQRTRKFDLTVGYGSAVDLSGNFTFTNNMASTFDTADSIWCAAFDAEVTNSGSGIINGGTYAASSNYFGGTEAASYRPSDFSDFDGESIAGTWRLTVRDEATNDFGTFAGWSFNVSVTGVPEPASLTILFMGGLVAVVTFVRRRSPKG